jgi:hypothetical protein
MIENSCACAGAAGMSARAHLVCWGVPDLVPVVMNAAASADSHGQPIQRLAITDGLRRVSGARTDIRRWNFKAAHLQRESELAQLCPKALGGAVRLARIRRTAIMPITIAVTKTKTSVRPLASDTSEGPGQYPASPHPMPKITAPEISGVSMAVAS